jgi:hypothetical protein
LIHQDRLAFWRQAAGIEGSLHTQAVDKLHQGIDFLRRIAIRGKGF